MLEIGNSQHQSGLMFPNRLVLRPHPETVSTVEKSSLATFACSRVLLCISTWLYAASLIFFLANYLAIEAQVYKYSFGAIAPIEIIACMISIAVVCSVLPKSLDRPSSLFLVSIHFFIYVPALVAIIGLDRLPEHNNDEFDVPLLAMITVGFVLANVLVARYPWQPGSRESTSSMLYILMAVWVVAFIVLLQFYSSIMTFASLELIYVQRQAGSAKSTFEGYLQTYFGYVISPLVLTIGLSKRRLVPIAMGFIGAIVLYMITAEKSAISYPFVMVGLYAMLSRLSRFAKTSFLGLTFAILAFCSAYFYQTVYPAHFVAVYFISRACMVPGIMVVFYSEYFQQNGYTFWSQTRGINLIVETPFSYAGNPRWPSLGHLVGEEYMGLLTLNANASFLASDGIASFGPIGALICFPLLAWFLIYADRFSIGANRPFAITLFLPLAMTITNGSLFTAMTSFGGFAFLFAFRFLFKSNVEAPALVRSSPDSTQRWQLI